MQKILTDESSASASEILSGALQDYGVATIVAPIETEATIVFASYDGDGKLSYKL